MSKDFRNALHYIAGGLIAFLLSLTFQGKNPIPEAIVILIVTTGLGAGWEIGRKIIYGYKPDLMDVLRTVAGGVLFLIFNL